MIRCMGNPNNKKQCEECSRLPKTPIQEATADAWFDYTEMKNPCQMFIAGPRALTEERASAIFTLANTGARAKDIIKTLDISKNDYIYSKKQAEVIYGTGN
jgi:hypothetical protein